MGWVDSLSDEDRRAARKAKVPGWVAPMLATLTHERFSDPEWIYERKLDGERCLVFRRGGEVKIRSRNRKLLNNTYPELVDALERQSLANFVVDGEIVAFEDGRTSFSRLQGRLGIRDPEKARTTGITVHLYLFDVLYLDGYDVTDLSLRRRKALLKRQFDFDDDVRYMKHRNEAGEALYREACRKGWEGVIAKDARSSYEHRRSRKWLKFKCGNRQEFVIGGYTEPRGTRKDFGALLLGYYEKGKLRFAGKVGTGFDDETLAMLGRRMRRIERESCPFDDRGLRKGKGVHWTRPELVAEVGFTEWTGEGRLRHPRFLGLRDDKKATDVVRERA